MAYLTQDPSKDPIGYVLHPTLDVVGQPVFEGLRPVLPRGEKGPDSNRFVRWKGWPCLVRLALTIEKIPFFPSNRCFCPFHSAQQPPPMASLVLASLEI